jgi:hypothetical protein
MPADLTVRDQIDLAPLDYYLVPWADLPPRPRPTVKAPPFQLGACLERVRAIEVPRPQHPLHGRPWWRFPNLRPPLSPGEVHFWLEVISRAKIDSSPEQLAEELRPLEFTGRLTVDEVLDRLNRSARPWLSHLHSLLPAILAPRDLVGFTLNVPADATGLRELLRTVLRKAIPYLTPEERDDLRSAVRERLRQTTWPANLYTTPDPAFHLAAFLGMHADVEAVVLAWPDDLYPRTIFHSSDRQQPQLVVFGLGSADLVEQHMRRLKLPLSDQLYVRAWLAHTGTSALDVIRNSILANHGRRDKNTANLLFAPLGRVRSPDVIDAMVEFRMGTRVRREALAWLEDNLGTAITGLVPLAAGRGKLAEGAAELLRDAHRQGHGEFVRTQVAAHPEVAEKVRKVVLDPVESPCPPLTPETTPPELLAAIPPTAPAGAPEWVETAVLPPILVADHRLAASQVRLVLGLLSRASLPGRHHTLSILRRFADPGSLDAFAWKLVELWLDEDAPSSEKWALGAVGHLGGDGCIARLLPFIRAWPAESQSPRAVLGLECLAGIGSDAALLALNGLAQKVRYEGLRKKARAILERVAKERGLGEGDLEDRIVPDLGLDAKGTRVLDFGPRLFTVLLGPDLTPVVRVPDGAIRKDPPKPGKADDPEKAGAAVAEWKSLKKLLKEVARQQAFRLEQAMVTGRRWNAPDFESYLVRHPLMTVLAQRLLWGVAEGGKWARTFRVDDNRQAVDRGDAPVALEGAKVGLVHPLQLSEKERQDWGAVFSDYELINPFAQLGRPTYGLEAGEEKAKTLTRFQGTSIPGLSLLGRVERTGWKRGALEDHGDFHDHSKHFPGAAVTAVIEYEPGLFAGSLASAEPQRITACRFFAGTAVPGWRERETRSLPLGAVDAVVLSEVLLDLHALVSRAA